MKKIRKIPYLLVLIVLSICFLKNSITKIKATDVTTSGAETTGQITINTSDDLTNVLTAINSGGTVNGQTSATASYLVTSDIVVSSWSGIKNFAGTFDGGNKTITLSKATAGLFVSCDGATISNVIIKGEINGGSYIGGIAGKFLNGSMSNCINYANITCSSSNAGGIVGYANTGSLSNCINYGTVKSVCLAGGVVGWPAKGQTSSTDNDATDFTYSNCANYGNVQITGNYDNNYPYVGAFFGYFQKDTVANIGTSISISCGSMAEYTECYTYYTLIFYGATSNPVVNVGNCESKHYSLVNSEAYTDDVTGKTGVKVVYKVKVVDGITDISSMTGDVVHNYTGASFLIKCPNNRYYVWHSYDKANSLYRASASIDFDNLTDEYTYSSDLLTKFTSGTNKTYNGVTASYVTASNEEELDFISQMVNGGFTNSSYFYKTGVDVLNTNVYMSATNYDMTTRPNFTGFGFTELKPIRGNYVGEGSNINVNWNFEKGRLVGFIACASDAAQFTREKLKIGGSYQINTPSSFEEVLIQGINISGNIKGKDRVAGLVAMFDAYTPDGQAMSKSVLITTAYATVNPYRYVKININNCNNYANVSGEAYVSGLLSISQHPKNLTSGTDVYNVFNSEAVKQYSDGVITISSCNNYGNISGKTNVGSFYGGNSNKNSYEGAITLTSSNNYGNVSGNTKVGLLYGYIGTSKSVSSVLTGNKNYLTLDFDSTYANNTNFVLDGVAISLDENGDYVEQIGADNANSIDVGTTKSLYYNQVIDDEVKSILLLNKSNYNYKIKHILSVKEIEFINNNPVYDGQKITEEDFSAYLGGETYDITYKDSSSNVITDIINAGTYTATVSNFNINDIVWLNSPTCSFDVAKRAITISANDKTSVYGDLIVTLSYDITSGSIVGSDNLNINLATTATSTSNVGEYDITISASNDNYAVTLNNAKYTITKRAITISANGKTSVYGDTIVDLDYNITSGSIVNSDDLNINLATTATSTSNVGIYDITISASNANYDVTLNNATYTITKRAITISLTNPVSNYGEEFNLNYDVTSGNIVNSDDLNIVFNISSSTELVIGENVLSILSNNTNYNITLSTTVYTINKGTLSAPDLEADNAVILGVTTIQINIINAKYSLDGVTYQDNNTFTGLDVGGEYTVYVYYPENEYYNASSVSFKTVTLLSKNDTSITYDGNISLEYGGASIDLNEYFSNNSGASFTYSVNNDVVSISGNILTIIKSGDFVLTVISAETPDYFEKESTFDLSVSKRAITLTANGKTSVYGDTILDLDYNITSGSIVGSDNLNIKLSTEATSTSNVGTYDITITASNDNYTIKLEDARYEITQKGVEIVWNTSESYTYNGTNQILSVSAKYTDINGLDKEATLNISEFKNAGTYEFVASITDGNYVISSNATKEIVMNKAAITLTAKNQTSVYGDLIATLNYDITSGSIFNNDDLNINLSTEALSTSSVGEYAITISASNNNYAITLNNATYTIKQKGVEIVWDASESYTYNGTNQILSVTAKYKDINGLDIKVTLNISEFKNAGTYEFVASITDGNYVISSNATKEIVMNKAAITLTAKNQTSVYGDLIATLSYDITSGSIFNNDDLNINLATEATSTSNVGTYPITISASNDNYDITLNNATYTITKRAITISANDKTSVYGDTIVDLDYTTSGSIIGSDNLNINLATTATSTSNVGEYDITITASNDNYNITLNNAKYTITKASLQILIDSAKLEYQEAFNNNITFKVEGIKNNDSNVVNYTDVNLIGVKLDGSYIAIGDYENAITATFTSSANYEIKEIVNGNLSVTKKNVSENNIVVSNVEFTYNGVIQYPTVTINDSLTLDYTVNYVGETFGGVEYDSIIPPTEAGNYTAIITIDSVYAQGTKSVTFNINKANRVIDGFSFDFVEVRNNKFYSVGDCVISIDNISFVSETNKLDDEQTYTVYCKVLEDSNYNESNTLSFNVKTYLSVDVVNEKINNSNGVEGLDLFETLKEIKEMISRTNQSDRSALNNDDYNDLISKYNQYVTNVNDAFTNVKEANDTASNTVRKIAMAGIMIGIPLIPGFVIFKKKKEAE